MYLKASAGIQVLDEYNGRKGQFVKTFALNDKRNKNGWRVTWDSIKKYISDFIDKPGIEFTKCENSICDLDHTDAATYQKSLEVQEDFRKTNIIDYTLDENARTAYFIHEVLDPEFYAKLDNGEIKYVSPSIWPKSGEYTILGKMPNGLPMLDVYGWMALHDAFVNNPAFGDDAKITATCEGEGCAVHLLTAAEKQSTEIQTIIFEKSKFSLKEAKDWLKKNGKKIPDVDETEDSYRFRQQDPGKFKEKSFRTISLTDGVKAVIGKPDLSASEDLAPLQQVPLLVRHKDHMVFASISSLVAREIDALFEKENIPNIESVMSIFKNNSLNACKCSSKIVMESDLKATLEAKEKELKAANENLTAAQKQIQELKSTMDEMKKAAKAKSKKGSNGDNTDDETNESTDNTEEEKKEVGAKKATLERIKILESDLAKPLIAKMVEVRQLSGATEDQVKTFEESLKAKSLEEIKSLYANEEILMNKLSANAERHESTHFEFNGGQERPLSAKSLEEIMAEAI